MVRFLAGEVGGREFAIFRPQSIDLRNCGVTLRYRWSIGRPTCIMRRFNRTVVVSRREKPSKDVEMPDTQTAFEALCQHARQTSLVESIESTLCWDERCMLPSEAGEHRAEQIAYLSGVVHQRMTDPRVGEWLAILVDSDLAADPHGDSGTTIRQLKREFDKQTKLPQDLVEELSRVSVMGQRCWAAARKNDDFAAFAPLLTRIIDLTKQKAECYGYTDHIYDALLDDYEPMETTANVAALLRELREELAPLVQRIVESPRQPNLDILTQEFPIEQQRRVVAEAAQRIGFDFSRGRLDETDHPFCTDIGPDDCRITTRYRLNDFGDGFFSVMHEAGHGIYQQGLRTEQFGLPPGSAVSLAIHESQSRLWENLVGRSASFWRHYYPEVRSAFPAALGDVDIDDFVFAINNVRPSLIRTEADEATYNLHIIIRFELEQDLLTGALDVADLPEAWNAKYEQMLGIRPDSDANGVLQDVHWSGAAIGYFSTYALGNLHAAQFFEQARTDLGDLDAQFAKGEFEPLLTWLREKIHRPGQCYPAAELIERVTGKPLSCEPLVRHLKHRFGGLYGIS
jgi:carboxypeptidase Taq